MIAAEYMDAKGEPHPLYGDGSLASACKALLQFSCWNADDPNCEVIEQLPTKIPYSSQL
jgi:hypothetical protein